jgi:uncharacterized protein (DUF1810 family)
MWFIFPQIEGLGYSPLARKFAISSREEAEAYLNHPILRDPSAGDHGREGNCRKEICRAVERGERSLLETLV